MGIEAIAGLVVVILAAIAGAFGIGHARGTSKAEDKAEQQRIKDNAAASVAAAEREAEATKGASDVQQTVNHMPDDDVDRELREQFTRPGSG
jgi:predicted cobalt transporter CbtA